MLIPSPLGNLCFVRHLLSNPCTQERQNTLNSVIDNGFHAVHTSSENMDRMASRIPQVFKKNLLLFY